MFMLRELDVVALTRDVPEHVLQRDDVGTIVHVYKQGAAYEVEFVTTEGETIALLTLDAADVRPMAAREILHVRPVASVP
jgi:hypothetical protein